MNKPRAGNQTPSSSREPIANWSKLSKGDAIDVHDGPELIASGRIDMLANDGSILWIIRDEGRGRSLFLQQDGLHIIRQATRRGLACANRR